MFGRIDISLEVNSILASAKAYALDKLEFAESNERLSSRFIVADNSHSVQ